MNIPGTTFLLTLVLVLAGCAGLGTEKTAVPATPLPAGTPASSTAAAEPEAGVTVSADEAAASSNAVAAEENRTEPVEINTRTPESVPSVPPLSPSALDFRIKRDLPEGFIPLQDKSRMVYISHDLDKNRYPDILLVAVREREGVTGEVGELRDTGRLFYEIKQPVEFALFIFYQYAGDLKLRYTVPLGEQLVFVDLFSREIRLGKDFPFTACISFKTVGGNHEVWVILQGRGISLFSIRETFSIFPVTEDIDGDGILDVVIHEHGVEEGMGYETFLTWYKWDGRDFKEHRSSNIVRNLRAFFEETEALILEGNWTAVLERSVLPGDLANLRGSGLTDEQILSRLFHPVDPVTQPLYFLELEKLIFPSLMETPFTYEKRKKPEFSFTIGANTPAGDVFYFEGVTVMNRNPFQANQFGFIPVE